MGPKTSPASFFAAFKKKMIARRIGIPPVSMASANAAGGHGQNNYPAQHIGSRHRHSD
jgi:hypothetical protein